MSSKKVGFVNRRRDHGLRGKEAAIGENLSPGWLFVLAGTEKRKL
jgi:hypothetical protein